MVNHFFRLSIYLSSARATFGGACARARRALGMHPGSGAKPLAANAFASGLLALGAGSRLARAAPASAPARAAAGSAHVIKSTSVPTLLKSITVLPDARNSLSLSALGLGSPPSQGPGPGAQRSITKPRNKRRDRRDDTQRARMHESRNRRPTSAAATSPHSPTR